MFLFKSTKNLTKRIGKNLTVYGLAGVFLSMLLSVILPAPIAPHLYTATVIFSCAFLSGPLILAVYSVIKLCAAVRTAKSTPPVIKRPYCLAVNYSRLCSISGNNKAVTTLLDYTPPNPYQGGYDRYDLYADTIDGGYIFAHHVLDNTDRLQYATTISHHTVIALVEAEVAVYTDLLARWEAADNTARAERCRETLRKLDRLLQSKNPLEHIPKTKVFKLKTEAGHLHQYTYLEHTRYCPNRSSISGYGSDDWFYLCEENDVTYVLHFTDDASGGTAWTATRLLPEQRQPLIKADIAEWHHILLTNRHARTSLVELTNIEELRPILPTGSRCHNPLTDRHFLAVTSTDAP